MSFLEKIAERVSKSAVQVMVQKTIKQKRLEFVDDHSVIYTEKDGTVKTLSFDEFAILMVGRVVEKDPRMVVGMTPQIFVVVLLEEYKKGVKKV